MRIDLLFPPRPIPWSRIVVSRYPLNGGKSRKLTNFIVMHSEAVLLLILLRWQSREHSTTPRHYSHTARKFNMQSEDINSGRIRGRGLCFCIWHYRWNYWISNWLCQHIQIPPRMRHPRMNERLPPLYPELKGRRATLSKYVVARCRRWWSNRFPFSFAFVSFMSFGNWILLALCPLQRRQSHHHQRHDSKSAPFDFCRWQS